MRAILPKWTLVCLVLLGGCPEEPQAPSEAVLRMKTCRRLMEDSSVVTLTLWKGLNEYERELIETERSLGLEKCLRRHPDVPGRCLDISDRESLRRSVELATTLCVNWPDELIACLRARDFYGPTCRRIIDEFRKPDTGTAGKKD